MKWIQVDIAKFLFSNMPLFSMDKWWVFGPGLRPGSSQVTASLGIPLRHCHGWKIMRSLSC